MDHINSFVHTTCKRLLSYEREEEDQGANSLFLFTRAEKGKKVSKYEEKREMELTWLHIHSLSV